jgi:hypothetical protein
MKLKIEIGIGMARLDRVLSKLEVFGLGQGGSEAWVTASPNEKEAWIKPNRKKYFKPKQGVGLGNESMGVIPSFMGLKNSHGWKALR